MSEVPLYSAPARHARQHSPLRPALPPHLVLYAPSSVSLLRPALPPRLSFARGREHHAPVRENVCAVGDEDVDERFLQHELHHLRSRTLQPSFWHSFGTMGQQPSCSASDRCCISTPRVLRLATRCSHVALCSSRSFRRGDAMQPSLRHCAGAHPHSPRCAASSGTLPRHLHPESVSRWNSSPNLISSPSSARHQRPIESSSIKGSVPPKGTACPSVVAAGAPAAWCPVPFSPAACSHRSHSIETKK